MDKPNIFNCATQEASLQAFLYWFLQWNDPRTMTINYDLHKLSRKLLEAFFNKHNIKPLAQIDKINLSGGYLHIDVLLTINDAVVIPIQDKIYNRESPDQLISYIQELKDCDDEYRNKIILPIYLQTGTQGNYKKINEAGFRPFSRKELLEILKSGEGISNDILKDYIEHLEGIENLTQSFMHRRLDDWDSIWCWQGFYNYLQDELGDGEWDVITNPYKTCLSFWWQEDRDNDCEKYLQLDKEILCFKIRVYDKDKRTNLKSKWSERFIKAAEGSSIRVVKPSLLDDHDITVAVIEGDYRRIDEDVKIDLNKTLNVIMEAQKVFNKALSV